MPTVTVYPDARSPERGEFATPEKLHAYIRNGRWGDLIERLNSFEPDSKEQRNFKVTLPGIVWQGKFSYRNDEGIVEHSGLVAMDYDHLKPEELELLMDYLRDDPYTYMLFKSCRMNGCKLIVKIPPSIEDHKQHVAGLADYHKISRDAYDHFDDLSRLCFVSYDPDIYFNPDSEVWTVKATPKSRSKSKPRTTTNTEPKPRSTTIPTREVLDRLSLWADRNSGYRDGNKHRHLVTFFSTCNVYGVELDAAIDYAYSKYSTYSNCDEVPESDFRRVADSVYCLYSHQHRTKVMTGDQTITHSVQSNPAPVRVQQPTQPETPEPSTVPFPVDVFPTPVADFINELNSTLNYSRDFTSTAIMFAIATLNGNCYKLRLKNGWVNPTLFWFAVVGEPGTMKTHPVNGILAPLKNIDKRSKLAFDLELESWERDVAYIKSQGKNGNHAPLPKRPSFKQMMISDITLEEIHGVHSNNKRGLGYHKDELVGFINDFNRYKPKGGSDEQFWLESFNNGSYIVNRVTKDPKLIEDTFINIIGTIQPDVLSKVIKDSHGNGLPDRFLFTSTETNIYPLNDRDISNDWWEWWEGVCNSAHADFTYNSKDDCTIIDMTEEGKAKMREIDEKVCELQRSQDVSRSMHNYLSKSKTYLPRLSLLVGIMDAMFNGTRLEVSASQVERADKIMKYFIASAAQIFTESGKSTEIMEILTAKKGLSKQEQIFMLAEKGYKFKDIANQLQVSPAYVSNVIAGKYPKPKKSIQT